MEIHMHEYPRTNIIKTNTADTKDQMNTNTISRVSDCSTPLARVDLLNTKSMKDYLR